MLQELREAILSGDQNKATELVNLCLEKGIEVKNILIEILSLWNEIAELYKKEGLSKEEENELTAKVGRIYVPTYSILFQLDQRITTSANPKGCVVVSCIKGDAHTLIKDLLALLLKSSGYQVIYRIGSGRETPQSIVEAIKTNGAEVLVLSVSNTELMPSLVELKGLLEKEELKILTIIGGRGITEETSRKLGFQIYADQPLSAIEEIERFITSRKNP